MVLRGINRTAWGTGLLLMPILASLISGLYQLVPHTDSEGTALHAL